MSLRKPRILFVEDHEDTRDLILLVLQQSHYEVTTAATIDDSLKLARSGKFNLFIFDSWLPDGSGIDLCKQVREFDHCTPVLFYSAAAYEKDMKLALSSGAQAYLVKPVETSELLQAIKSLMIIFFENRKFIASVWKSLTTDAIKADGNRCAPTFPQYAT